MVNLIVTGHGQFAEGMQGALSLIAGDLDHITFVGFNNDVEALKQGIETAIKAKPQDEFLVLADLVGGTPFKTAALLTKEYAKVKVIGGANLPMLLSIAYETETPLEELTTLALDAGKNGIMLLENF